eukprot:4895422-Prorocentrum_lima.AAC.1
MTPPASSPAPSPTVAAGSPSASAASSPGESLLQASLAAAHTLPLQGGVVPTQEAGPGLAPSGGASVPGA